MMRVNQLLGMGACFAMLALTGCMDKDVYDPGKDPTVLKPESEYFDFTTTTMWRSRSTMERLGVML